MISLPSSHQHPLSFVSGTVAKGSECGSPFVLNACKHREMGRGGKIKRRVAALRRARAALQTVLAFEPTDSDAAPSAEEDLLSTSVVTAATAATLRAAQSGRSASARSSHPRPRPLSLAEDDACAALGVVAPAPRQHLNSNAATSISSPSRPSQSLHHRDISEPEGFASVLALSCATPQAVKVDLVPLGMTSSAFRCHEGQLHEQRAFDCGPVPRPIAVAYATELAGAASLCSLTVGPVVSSLRAERWWGPGGPSDAGLGLDAEGAKAGALPLPLACCVARACDWQREQEEEEEENEDAARAHAQPQAQAPRAQLQPVSRDAGPGPASASASASAPTRFASAAAVSSPAAPSFHASVPEVQASAAANAPVEAEGAPSGLQPSALQLQHPPASPPPSLHLPLISGVSDCPPLQPQPTCLFPPRSSPSTKPRLPPGTPTRTSSAFSPTPPPIPPRPAPHFSSSAAAVDRGSTQANTHSHSHAHTRVGSSEGSSLERHGSAAGGAGEDARAESRRRCWFSAGSDLPLRIHGSSRGGGCMSNASGDGNQQESD